jgi:hypothetical protein
MSKRAATVHQTATTAALTRINVRRTLEAMPAGFDTAFARVKALVADFRANEKFYLSPAYQEQEARRDFIDKFWLAFGWDVNHETQKNPFEQKVKIERREHGFSQRRADYAFYLAPIFQKGNALGRMRSRSDGRCLFKKETFASDGCHSVGRQQRHRIEIGIHSSCARNQRLAEAPAVARQTRFRFSETAPRSVCGWLFLAPMSVALPDASRQSAILARKNLTKRRERSRNNSPVAPDWLASDSALAALFEGFGLGCGSHKIRIEHNRLIMQR